VGIGTSLPQAKLDVNGNALVSGDLTVSGCNLYITNGGVGIGTTTSSTVSQLAVNAETRLYKDITLSDRVDVGGYYSGGMRIRGVVDLAYDGENISRGGSKGHRGIEWYYANNNRWGMVQDSLYNLAIYTSSSVVIDDEGSAITFNKTNTVDNTSTTAFSEFGRFNYQGYLGIGTTRPTQKLHVQGGALISGSVSAASLTGTDITTSNLTVLNTLTLGGNSTALRNRLQVNSARKVFYVDTSTKSTFVVSSDGIFGGYSSNVDVFVNQNKLSYMTSNYADYDLTYAWTSGSNTDYTVTLTQAAVFGDIVDITIWPQIVQLSSTQPGYVYQNISLTYFNKTTISGTDIYYLGNTGIGTITPTQKLHVQGDALVTGNLTVTGSNITNVNVINNIEYNSSNVIINNVSGAGPALKVSQTGVGASYPIADFYDNDISTTIPAFRIADGGNVGIGTTNPSQKLEVNGNIKIATGYNLYKPFIGCFVIAPQNPNGVLAIYKFSIAVTTSGHYSTVTGQFTCPIEGYYSISVSILNATTGNNAFRVYKNNAFTDGVSGVIGYNSTTEYATASTTSILLCGVNDTLDVRGLRCQVNYSSMTIHFLG